MSSDPVGDGDHDVQLALGNVGPWNALIPAAWQAAALPGAPAPLLVRVDPADAARMTPSERVHAEAAYWTPLVHLLAFGLGWTRLDLGLHRWVSAGMPTDDPVLAAVARGWGEHMAEFLGWLCQDNRGVHLADRLAADTPVRRLDDPSPQVPLRPAHPELAFWHQGLDGLHVLDTVALWLENAGEATPRVFRDARAGADRQVLMVPTYAGWRQALKEFDSLTPAGRSVRVDVVCRPVGWLGSYRRSRETGGWFRGRHRWHVMGA